MEPLNQRQGFLVSAIVHLTLLMILLSRPPAEKFVPTQPPPEEERTARVFVPPAETLRRVLPPTALRPAASSRVFDGMQAQKLHSPPTRLRSTTATFRPSWAERLPAASPPAPAPITTTS